MVDMTKKHYISNKERFTQEFLDKVYNDKLIIDGFPVYTNYPRNLETLMRSNQVDFKSLLKEAKITSRKPYAAMQYQLYGYGFQFVVMAFLTEKFSYAYVYNVDNPNCSECGSILLDTVVRTAHLPF